MRNHIIYPDVWENVEQHDGGDKTIQLGTNLRIQDSESKQWYKTTIMKTMYYSGDAKRQENYDRMKKLFYEYVYQHLIMVFPSLGIIDPETGNKIFELDSDQRSEVERLTSLKTSGIR